MTCTGLPAAAPAHCRLQQKSWTRDRMLETFLHHARLALELQDMKRGPGQLPPDADERLRDPLIQLGFLGNGSMRLVLAVKPIHRGLPFVQLRPEHLQPAAASLTIRCSQRYPEVRCEGSIVLWPLQGTCIRPPCKA